MGPFIASVIVLVLLTVIAVFWFKKSFFKSKEPEELFDENSSEFDKALMTKDPQIAIYRHRNYFAAVAGFITMVYVVTFVQYKTVMEKLEEKADAKAAVSQMKQMEITEQEPPKPKKKPKSKKPPKEKIVEEEIPLDTTEIKEIINIQTDFGEEEEEEEGEEEYIPPIVERAEVRAKFPGGPIAFMKWVVGNVEIPQKDKEKGTRGMVMVQFVVYEDGFIRDVEIVRGINDEINANVVKLIGSSPKWSPPMVQGRPVRERWRYPVKIVPR